MIVIALFAVIAICFGGMTFCLFMLYRNEWVFAQRMKFHAEIFKRSAASWYAIGRPSIEDICGTYDAMVWRFWIWDRERFRRRSLPPSDL